jgi:RNA polymerase sigma-70 factor (sigma-E family)
VSADRDAEFTEYVEGRLAWLRKVAYLLCEDWQRADDLVQATVVQIFTHWGRIRGLDNSDGYVRTILIRVFLGERRSGWGRKVTLPGYLPDGPAQFADTDASLDIRSALAALPPRQRATLVLRYYCDLDIIQTANALGCSTGTVKSQTAKGLNSLRQALEPTGPGTGTGKGTWS